MDPCYLVDSFECSTSVFDGEQCSSIRINEDSPYECEGFRLPMEAEWEYAARAGTVTSFPTGNITVQGSTGGRFEDPALLEMGRYCINSYEQAHHGAQKRPNAWGLYDMHGNHWEHVNDLY